MYIMFIRHVGRGSPPLSALTPGASICPQPDLLDPPCSNLSSSACDVIMYVG